MPLTPGARWLRVLLIAPALVLASVLAFGLLQTAGEPSLWAAQVQDAPTAQSPGSGEVVLPQNGVSPPGPQRFTPGRPWPPGVQRPRRPDQVEDSNAEDQVFEDSPVNEAQAPAAPVVPVVFPPAQVVSPGAQPVASTLKVDYASGKLSVTADKVPLSQVLREVGRQTGLEVRGLTEASQTASVQFSNLSVAQAIRSLLGGANYALLGSLESPAEVKQARVVMMSATAGAEIDVGTEARAAQGAASQAQRETLRAQLMSTNPAEQDAGFRELQKLSPKDAFAALEDVIANGDGVARLRALQFMDQDSAIDQASLMGALRSALDDPDGTLRDYAVQALGRHPGTESLNLLRQVFSDGDATVRLNVVEAISERSDGHALLQQAASDPDQAVSSLANEVLSGALITAP